MAMSEHLAICGGSPAVTSPAPAWPVFASAEANAMMEVLNSGKWGSTSGNSVTTFESEFAAHQHVKHVFALSNGTLALAAALSAGGVGIGDEVIAPSYTFIATAAAALFVGAIPVFADVKSSDHLLDPTAVRAAITDRTKAVIPVHLAGGVADMDEFAAIHDEHGLLVIEDGAQATGAKWKGTPIGGLGSIGTFSFQSSKNLTAGEGGAVATNDDLLADALHALINVGRRRPGRRHVPTRIGYNLRLTEFQAAVLQCQLDRFDTQQQQHEHAAGLLAELLADVSGLVVDTEDDRMTAHGRHLFMMRLPNSTGEPEQRDAVVEALNAEGLTGASGGYLPLHRNTALLTKARSTATQVGNTYPEPDCPTTDQVCTDTIWLPHHWLLADDHQIGQVAAAITKVLQNADQLRPSRTLPTASNNHPRC
ncbi:DegT/DnrJ/EryC1/StrS family aminotransferase [Parenemella sanctibonifatiensis]|uniref:Glutamine--scyllo-inositol aminotransferase n=1 Tax=Parenemella sanctibonifatiensis TaxID=2016505 RepID=A0A255E9Y9_9ACTN|nr:DegT/DnrJ/EryC1/StrS family aminotransferase [Parenemella sanctibonifatiensis]OYN88384.1 glutamine--scyllo-inositol aminotransferase [Parenemella sanctibonifatiensis]